MHIHIYIGFHARQHQKAKTEVIVASLDPGVLTTRPQNICGVSVVDHRFEELKRYNISEIFDPTPKEEAVKPVDNKEEAKKAEVTAEVVPTAVVDDDNNNTGKAETTEAVQDVVAEGDGGVSVSTSAVVDV